jgi:arylmalonate decarboxylase
VTIGLVVPYADDRVPAEGLAMYPDVRFTAKGVGVQSMTPEGYEPAMMAIRPAADVLAALGVAAIMVIGTSLTFYKGAAEHRRLIDDLRRATGLPVSTMSAAVADGLRALGARRIAVATAYADEVNRRLKDFLEEEGFEVGAIEGFGITEFGGAARSKSDADIMELSARVCAAARDPQALLISCGGLRTLGVAKPFEHRHRVPVVSSMPAGFWGAVRLVGLSGRVPGCGRLLEQSSAA